jgi:hypothetical protein
MGPHESNYCYLYYPVQVPISVQTTGGIQALRRGPDATIDVFNMRWWVLLGPGIASRGAHHQHLQHKVVGALELRHRLPRGPPSTSAPSTSSTSVVSTARPAGSTP